MLPPKPLEARTTSPLLRARTLVLIIILCDGVLLRVAQYVANRSLRLDEALLTFNLQERSFAELFRPLDHNQAAPIGFLLVEKALIQVFGCNEYVLRLYPLLAGIATLFLVYLLARHFGGPSAGRCATLS